MAKIRSQLQIAEAKRFQVESELKIRYENMLAEQLQKQRNELETRHSSKVERFTQLLYNPQHKRNTVKYNATACYEHIY